MNKKKYIKFSLVLLTIIILMVLFFCKFNNIKNIMNNKQSEVNKNDKNTNEEKKSPIYKDDKIILDGNETNDLKTIYKEEIFELEFNQKITKTINLNGKTHTILIEPNNCEECFNDYITFDTKKIFLNSLYTNYNKITYVPFKSEDGNDYLVISFYTWAADTFILDDNGNILKEINSHNSINDEVGDCFINIKDFDGKIFKIVNNKFYYYKNTFNSPIKNDNEIDLKEYELYINNGTVVENETGDIITGYFGQCD